MNSFKILFPSAIALVLASCASNKGNEYDTSSPYGPADASASTAPYQPVAPANQTYDTPAAYEDSTTAPASPDVNLPAANKPPINPAPVYHGGSGTVHTVVKGDTLSGIASKYKVSSASIKQANAMTKDTVVLGKKLTIPAR